MARKTKSTRRPQPLAIRSRIRTVEGTPEPATQATPRPPRKATATRHPRGRAPATPIPAKDRATAVAAGIAGRIKTRREALAMTETQAAARAGVQSWTWSRWERDAQGMDIPHLLLTAAALNTTAAALLEGMTVEPAAA
jgi:hypothetical protein